MSQDLVTTAPSAPSAPSVPALPTAGVCVVIPARGGSKGVQGKNLRPVGGVPLLQRAVDAVRAVPAVDTVVVSTDDHAIAAVARAAGAEVVERPAHLAGDLASSESALVHALVAMAARDTLPGITVFVQATSPFIRPADVDRAVTMVREGRCDVAFSVTRSDVHLWRGTSDGATGVNHDPEVRLRRQDREAEYAETGAFYVMRTEGFLEHRHRFFGRVRFVEVDAEDALEIDTEHDLRLAELVHERRTAELRGSTPAPASAPVSAIPARAVVTDFDGVHTDDSVAVDQHGTESVTVSRHDGMGVAMLRRAGVPVLILSTETNPVVRARAAKLGVEAVTGCADKLPALRQWAEQQGIALSDVAYLGNDVNDLGCLGAVGWPVVVADAHPDVLATSPHVLRRPGGGGAVRELADRVLAGTTARSTARPTERHDHG